MRLLHQYAAIQADRRPAARAVVLGDDALTYRELDDLANGVAAGLAELGVEKGDRVCLLMPKTPTAIASILGVLKLGGVYVPLDPDSPPARMARIVAACDTPWIVGAGPVHDTLESLLQEGAVTTRPVLAWLDATLAPPDVAHVKLTRADLPTGCQPPETEVTSADTAYILFTSGSTGQPKGVPITHGSVDCFLDWAIRYFRIVERDRLSAHPPLHFDLSVFDLFGALAAGAELHPIPPELNLLPGKLAQVIRGSQLTQWFSVPSVLNYMAKFDVVTAGDFPELRRLLWCGEVLPTATLRYFMERLPHVQFTNLYGPTESTIASSYFTVPAPPATDSDSIPIGRSCEGEELLVLDEHLAPVASGETGELFIGGVGLSAGYWRDPVTTSRAFIADPRLGVAGRLYRTGDLARVDADGLVHFVGRADTQVKSRGYRIELGEIEAALATQAYLRESAIVAVPSEGFEGTAICCAYVLMPAAEAKPRDIKAALAAALPSYMLPTRWRAFDALPRNANGKVDRPRLRDEFASGAAARR